MEHGQVLETDSDFDNAILLGVEISVTQYGAHLGSGRILYLTEHSVKMMDCYFFKDGCEFTVCSLVH
jgi:hypothetical protein